MSQELQELQEFRSCRMEGAIHLDVLVRFSGSAIQAAFLFSRSSALLL
jgi:hypothetical protein